MSSSPVERGGGGTRWRSLLGGRSITAHIARLYALSAAVLLAIIVGLLQWVEVRSLQGKDAYLLTDKVQQLRMMLHQHTFLEQEVEVEGGVYASDLHYHVYSRVLDDRGNVLTETPGMASLVPPELFPPPKEEPDTALEAKVIKATGTRSYMLVSAWGETGGDAPARRIIQVALDNADEKEFFSLYQRGSMLLMLLGILASARIGVSVAQSGMRPLGEIARVADQVTASQLHKRLQPERWPLELTSLAKAFDGMLGRLDESHTRLSQFSSDLAHELRTPIQILLGQTEVALSKERPAEEYRRILASNLEEFQRLTRMINELLFLARAEDPTTQIERRWLDARRELEAVREFHEALAEDHAVTVTCEGQAEVFAEPRLIHRAVTNLLSNALRHTPRGGQIVLSVAPVADAVVFKVSDSGCGIRSEDLPRIFERLYSPDRGTANSAEGTGLGLAIVRSIAEMHGGTAAVESYPGQGTTVTLTIPTGRPASPSTAGA